MDVEYKLEFSNNFDNELKKACEYISVELGSPLKPQNAFKYIKNIANATPQLSIVNCTLSIVHQPLDFCRNICYSK